MENFPKNMAVAGFKRERELFLSVAAQAYRKRLLESDERPTQYDIAELLGTSRATFNRNITKYRTSWKEVGLIARQMLFTKHDCSCLHGQDFSQSVRQLETSRDAQFQPTLYPTRDRESRELFD